MAELAVRILPVHVRCPHEQSMSGVFSVVSHSTLQYFPDVVRHEQTGWAHFSAFVAVIFPLKKSHHQRMIRAAMLVNRQKLFCTQRNTLRLSPYQPTLRLAPTAPHRRTRRPPTSANCKWRALHMPCINPFDEQSLIPTPTRKSPTSAAEQK